MHHNENVWEYMAKSLFGEASEEELRLLQQELQDHPELQRHYDILKKALVMPGPAAEIDQKSRDEIASIFEKATLLENTATTRRRPRRIWWPAAVAATLALAFVIGKATWMSEVPGKEQTQGDRASEISAARGSRTNTILPDGSRVWLNSGSKLVYVTSFTGSTREVRLTGEAFFDIVKDSTRPFIVHANHVDIRVVGTAFNVKAYPAEQIVETILYRGQVNVSRSDDKQFKTVVLRPNEKIILPAAISADRKIPGTPARHAIADVVITHIDSTVAEPLRPETAWMHNRLEFDGEDFATLARRMERWYDVSITFQDEAVKRLSFRGSFEHETISQALAALQAANPFTFNIQNNEIFIRSNK